MLIVVVLLVGGLALALRFPSVQTKVARKAASVLSETIHHQVTIGTVDVRFFKSVLLNEVRVLDRQKKTLFYVGQADADIGFFQLFKSNPLHIPLFGKREVVLPWAKFQPNRLHIASLTLTRPEANLIKYEGTDTLNMSTFITALSNLVTKDTTKAKTPFDFKIDEIVLKDGLFTYHNFNIPRTDYGLDYQHMDLERINGRFSEISLKGDTIQTVVTSLTTMDRRSKTYLKDLDTRMTFAPTFWEWANLNLRVNNSHLARYVRFDYRIFWNFKEFNDSMNVTATFDSTYVTSDDIALFAPVLKDVNEKVLLSGKVKGKVKNFRAEGIDVRYGQYTHIKGDISADGLPNFKNTFADLNLERSTINARDIKKFLPKKAYDMAARAGTVTLEGEFTGFYNDFVANGAFQSALGNVVSDINLKFDKNNIDRSAYRGYLKTNGFDVGGLLGDRSVLKRVAMDGRVTGSGFSLASARLNVDATINALNLNNYNFRNIVVNADLSRQTFNGDLSINDPNLKMAASGQINLQNNRQVFDLKTNIKSADLRALGFTEQGIVLSTNADVDFTGIKLDEIYGLANFKNTKLLYGGKQVGIDSLTIESHFHDGIRELHVGSEVLALKAGGNFLYSTFFRDLQTLYEEYRLNLENNPLRIESYYRRKSPVPPASYEVNLDVHLRHINPVLHAFAPDLSISDFSTMEGTFRNGPTSVLTLISQIDTILYGKNEFYSNNLEITSSKLWNTPDVLANAVVTSERQKLGNAGDTEKLYVEGVWSERLISFSSNIAQTGTTNRANISGNVSFERDQIAVVFNRSNINVLDKVWNISPNNTIVYNDGAMRFENVTLSNGPQSVNIFGVLSRNPQDLLTVSLANFRLENLNPLLPDKIDGRLNAQLQLRDLYNEMQMSSTLAVDTFMIGNQLIGNVAGTTQWESRLHRMNVDLGISRENKKVLSLTGTYTPSGGKEELDLLAVLDDAQMKLVEPVLKTIMSDLGGTMDGRVRISGKLSGPVLKGSVMVTEGSFVFNYLKTKYTFSDRVFFTENDISFQNVRIRDIYNNVAILNGGIFHDGFQNMVLDLRARFNRFMVLNTTRADNPLYYGTAFASGEVTALGSTSNLQVNITARSENNTSIAIPLDNTSSLERQNFISFVNNNPAKQDSAGTATPLIKKGVDLSGIRLNFNLDVDENAYIELIFDERTGDIIRGKGRGNIRMEIDTRGEFAMYGNYEIVQGRYNFTMLGLINKEFNVRPGGTVTWNGNPLDGLLKITATYTQRVSLAPILADLSEQQQQSAAARSRYPVTAVMDLDGPLTTPQIRLNLEFNDTPSLLEDQITRYLNNIRNDEQELNRQVFSLLAFKRLSAQDELQVGLGVGDLGSSVGELFSNQLSYWLSQIDTNLEVDIGVSGYGNQVLDDVQLRLSYTFLEGRLKVTREGSVNNNRLGSNRSTAAGDWSVEYYLSQSGQLRLRATYETTPRDFEANATASRQTVSVLHQANFDRFGELFRRRKLSKRAQRAAERERMIRLEDDAPTTLQDL
ncbi:translocation/assembly module TamB domain-containing protein [Rufibacter latericius]|uniref:translocation/assembly module TamB domain-containing protein n=1 Tax=Rufibacter latericius TaxID=2487040 RepID=UPI000F629D29|nr:translocation/assembly module TamB domain-containing protein [Rufibacter latericius]